MFAPLNDIRVIDLTKVLAGPLCTQYLSDLGAEVVKIEPIDGGDDTRRWPPFVAGGGTFHLSVNRNKQSLAVDLKSPQGQEIVHRLVAEADVFVQSYGAGVVERLKLDHATLAGVNPRLVYCTISGFGRTGPLADLPGYDVIGQAFSGLMTLSGTPDSGPVRIGFSPLDQVTGLHALSGILAGLLQARQSGRGTHLEVSLLESALGLLCYTAQSFWATGAPPRRMGLAHDSLCPYQAFETADGLLFVGVASDTLWRKLCVALGLEAYMDDPRYRTNPERVARYGETAKLVGDVLAQASAAVWLERLTAAGVPCSKINTVAEVLDHPQVHARDMILDYDHPAAGRLRGIAHPVLFDGQRAPVRSPPPGLGEHTDAILLGAGYDREAIAALRARGILGPPAKAG